MTAETEPVAKPEKSKTKQFKEQARLALHKNITARFTAAEEEIKKLSEELEVTPPVRSKTAINNDIDYLVTRKKQLALSLSVIYNTSAIIEKRKQMITGYEAYLDLPDLEELKKDIYRNRIKLLKKADRCTKGHCFGRGFQGTNVSTGEMVLCECTLNILDFYTPDI